MSVLNIDMDYFLNTIHYNSFNDYKRLESNEYIPWEKEEFIYFIENKLGLKKDEKIIGKVVTHHHEVFYYWRDKIEKGALKIPFKIVHIDAHIDLSYMPDGSWKYINDEYINYPYNKKIYPENIKFIGKQAKFDCGNYMLYAVASGWIDKMDYVYHRELEYIDCPHDLLKKEKDGMIFSLGNKETNNMKEMYINTINKEDFIMTDKIDLITVAQSPNFTPVESDELLNILKEYLILE